MALIGLKVPHETARLLEGIEVPGDRHSASDMHVTVLYLGKSTPIIQVAKCMIAANEVIKNITPFECTLKSVSSFPAGDDGVPIKCDVISPGILNLYSVLSAELNKLGLPYSTKYDYNPHVTLSYITDGSVDSYESLLPGTISWVASELVIWGGDDGERDLSITIPFVLSPIQRAANNLVRFPRIRG